MNLTGKHYGRLDVIEMDFRVLLGERRSSVDYEGVDITVLERFTD